jgi:dihydropteroate synthase
LLSIFRQVAGMDTPLKWSVGHGRQIDLDPHLVVGILNVTPDSFYDGGVRTTAAQSVARAEAMLVNGAGMIDIGGESTRPYAEPVDAGSERGRVVPVVRQLLARNPGTCISVDTTKSVVADACLKAGAEVVNDVSAGALDPELLDVVAQYRAGYVLMHSLGGPETMQDNPCYGDVVDEILAFFEHKLGVLTARGIPEEKIVLDPGIGFGKRLEHNLEVLRRIESFFSLGRPVYMGLSNKSLWGGLLGLPVEKRILPTQVATALLATRGVRIHRVHEVKEAVQALTISRALKADGHLELLV